MKNFTIRRAYVDDIISRW